MSRLRSLKGVHVPIRGLVGGPKRTLPQRVEWPSQFRIRGKTRRFPYIVVHVHAHTETSELISLEKPETLR